MISISKCCLVLSKQGKTLINDTNPISSSSSLKTTIPQLQILSLTVKMSSWACSTCTYLNPPDQKTRCEICHSAQPQSHPSPSPSSSPSKPQWSCSSCTFLNPYRSASCEICGTRESASLISTLEVGDDEVELGSSVGSVFLPLKNLSSNSGGAGFYGGLKGSVPPLRRGDCGGLGNGGKKDVGDGGGEGRVLGVTSEGFSLKRCSKRKEREEEDAGVEVGRVGDVIRVSSGFRAPKAAGKAIEVGSSGETHKSSDPKTWKIMSYNIWFREDLEMRERMRALGYLIELHSPDVICFQVLPILSEFLLLR
ncbi:endonuclease/exonuclease/phosphatase family protein [Striga asiatica]|uniref:Endonuclease/exonuclease/phosphatase family protein n=1 Tax=Striga asiatica TaxID=4170 RepID=A0A5A7QIX5_STRAF|nr:endonuclease/exonuclease/phosphatase family protein [Striga asiatica]